MRGMAKVPLSGMSCSIARALDVVGDRWTLLIVRDALGGARRFEDFAASLPIARNVLSDRLAKLVEAGVLERCRYQDRPERFEYRLTQAGLGLYPTLVALMSWGERHTPPGPSPSTTAVHSGCGHNISVSLSCDSCGSMVEPASARWVPGAGRSTP